MTVQVETGSYDGIKLGGEVCGGISANLVRSGDAAATGGMIEIRLNTDGATGTLRLTKTEADVFSLLLARLAGDPDEVDDLDVDSEISAIAERITKKGRSITRDELIGMLLNLPRKSEIDVQIGTEHVGITGVVPWGRGRKNWAALQCHRPDFLEVLEGWRLPEDVQEQIIDGRR